MAPLSSWDAEGRPSPNGSAQALIISAAAPVITTLRMWRTLLGLLDRPPREDPGQMLLVFGAGPQVARGVQAVGRVLRRLLWLRALAERILDSLRAHRRRANIGQPDAPVAVHLLSRGSDDCPVEEPAAKLDVLV